MRRASVFRKTLRDLRWQVFWYGLGFALLAALIVYVYPSYRDQLADFEIQEAFEAFLGEAADYATPEGYLTAEFFSWAPIMLVIFAIMQGTNMIAGEEASGTLDILLAQPIGRARLVLEKLAAFVVGSFAIAFLTLAGWALSIPFVDMDIAAGPLAVATLNMVPVTLVFGAFALMCSVGLSGRGQATGVATAVAVAAFMVNYLASLVEVLQPLRWLSPFYYANTTSVLSSGMDWARFSVLLLLFAAFSAASVWAFGRRDIGIRPAGAGALRIFGRKRAGEALAPGRSLAEGAS